MKKRKKQHNRRNKKYQRKLYKKALSQFSKIKKEIVQVLRELEIKVTL